MKYSVKKIDYNTPEYAAEVDLRRRILRIPLGLDFTTEELKKDENDAHLGLFEGPKLLACLILTEAGGGKLKMRQVAVDAPYQSMGLGKMLSVGAEEYGLANGYHTIFCHARKSAAPFYQKLGYKIVGNEFTEVTIPHCAMEKRLK